METIFFGSTTINIIIGFAILAFALIAIFTNSTPVKWVASLLAIVGMGVLYRRIFPSDSEIKRKFEENEAEVDQHFEDRKRALEKIAENDNKIKDLEEKKKNLDEEDDASAAKLAILDTDIEQLKKKKNVLEESVETRKKKLDSFFSRKDQGRSKLVAAKPPTVSVTSIGAYSLKGDLE